MNFLAALHALVSSLPLAGLAVILLLAGGLAIAWPAFAGLGARSEMKRRLRVDAPQAAAESAAVRTDLREKAGRAAQEFYARADAENVARLRMKLIQAGYMDAGAVGLFFLARFAAAAGFGVAALIAAKIYGASDSGMSFWMFAVFAAGLGYFAPSMALANRVRARQIEYRNGFPDFMDLMVVCSDAGMSMEAAIERVSREIGVSYPALSDNLRLVSIELRAGRNLDDALKSLAERLSLDEVRSFATLLQQSRELGTSLSGALRVFSDEMRHKRMSMAEEKAHALPAKMSVPVTMCILPVIMMVAVIPIIVKFSSGD